MKTQKLDFYEAARLVLLNITELKEFYAEDAITIDNFYKKNGAEIYDIVCSGLSVGFLQKDGYLITGEDGYRLSTKEERESYGERIFKGTKKTWVINKGKSIEFFKYFDVEGTPELESWEKDF